MDYYYKPIDANNPSLGVAIFPDAYGNSLVGATKLDDASKASSPFLPEGDPRWKLEGGKLVQRTDTDRAERLNIRIDRETHSLIKAWCAKQDEGCEEAFLNLGIDDPKDARYLQYRAERAAIIAEQSKKKAQ